MIGRVRIGVDRHDVLRTLAARQVLDGAADAAGEVEVRRDAGARLADLLVVRAPAEARHDPRDADGGTEELGQLLDRSEALGAADPTPAADDDAGVGKGDAGAATHPLRDLDAQVLLAKRWVMGVDRRRHGLWRRCGRDPVEGDGQQRRRRLEERRPR